MNDIAKIEKKIKELILKKEKLQKKESEHLHKKLIDLLGDEFSPDLVLGMIVTSWQHKNTKSMEDWKRTGATFRTRPTQKALPSKSKNNQIHPAG